MSFCERHRHKREGVERERGPLRSAWAGIRCRATGHFRAVGREVMAGIHQKNITYLLYLSTLQIMTICHRRACGPNVDLPLTEKY
jgi:hypothetical protein